MTLSRSNPRATPRWLALLTILMLGTALLATSVLASHDFVFLADDGLANDEPGQKDLTAQASDFDGSVFYTAWKWDDTAWNGNNTGDGCSLFDSITSPDGFVDFAVCVTIEGKTPTLVSVTVYSCSDGRIDRCTNSVLLFTDTTTTYCQITNGVDGPYDDPDTQATCNISAIDAASTDISGLDGAPLVNTCSYPSKQPNSDPSDCVITVALQTTSIATQASATWSVTLNDTATMTPSTATGTVVFKLWGVKTGTPAVCSIPIWESAPVLLASGTASTVGAATATGTTGTNIITNTNVDIDGIYYWTVEYTPTTGAAFNTSSSLCGATNERTTISVTHGS